MLGMTKKQKEHLKHLTIAVDLLLKKAADEVQSASRVTRDIKMITALNKAEKDVLVAQSNLIVSYVEAYPEIKKEYEDVVKQNKAEDEKGKLEVIK